MTKENLHSIWVGVAVVAAFVSVGGICLAIGGLLLSEYDLTKYGVGMIAAGTATYVTILNYVSD